MPSVLPGLPVAFSPQAPTKGLGRKRSPLAGEKAEIGWEQWGFGEKHKKSERKGLKVALKSSCPLKTEGREDLLC